MAWTKSCKKRGRHHFYYGRYNNIRGCIQTSKDIWETTKKWNRVKPDWRGSKKAVFRNASAVISHLKLGQSNEPHYWPTHSAFRSRFEKNPTHPIISWVQIFILDAQHGSNTFGILLEILLFSWNNKLWRLDVKQRRLSRKQRESAALARVHLEFGRSWGTILPSEAIAKYLSFSKLHKEYKASINWTRTRIQESKCY